MENLQNNHDHDQVVVVMVPLPAQGHLNQLLQLSRLISAYNIPVHFIGSASHNRQAKARVQGWSPISVEKMHFRDFELAPFLSPPPNPNNPLTKFPTHLMPSFEAVSNLRGPVLAFLRSLSSKVRRLIVIFDSLMASVVQDVCSISNAEAYKFHSSSALVSLSPVWESKGRPIDFGIPNNLPSPLDGCITPEFLKFAMDQYNCRELKSSGNLYNTSRLIEPSYMDLLAKEEFDGSNRHWAIGPFNPLSITKDEKNHGRHKCLEWLDKQEKNSVIYISFGTMASLNDDEINELAIGLEQSKQKFIWVLRDADKGDIYEKEDENEVRRDHLELLPKGYEERVKEMGILVRDWAPQLEILGHESTGGFMSHCGWNSCMESITMGVPIAAWPMHSDQPKNTVLITRVLKLGIEVKDWTRRNEAVTSMEIEEAVTRLMASEEGDDIRKRAAELGETLQHSMDQGGVYRLELDSFIAHVTR